MLRAIADGRADPSEQVHAEQRLRRSGPRRRAAHRPRGARRRNGLPRQRSARAGPARRGGRLDASNLGSSALGHAARHSSPIRHSGAARKPPSTNSEIDVFVPGHGSIGGRDQLHARIDPDRAYVHSLRDADALSDPRLDPTADSRDWLPGAHARQLQRLADRSEHGMPG